MSGQNSVSAIKPTSPIKGLSTETYLDEPQDMKSKITNENCIKDFKKLKKDVVKQFIRL